MQNHFEAEVAACCADLDARSLRLAEPLAMNSLGTQMFQTGVYGGDGSSLSTLQSSLNSLPPLPATGGNTAYSYSSNGTHYSLSSDNDGQQYQVTIVQMTSFAWEQFKQNLFPARRLPRESLPAAQVSDCARLRKEMSHAGYPKKLAACMDIPDTVHSSADEVSRYYSCGCS